MKTSEVLTIHDSSQVGEARRAANRLAESAGFNETERGKLSIIATELANNLVKHTQRKGGELIIRYFEENSSSEFTNKTLVTGIEILSLDKGPGIGSIAQCMQDGYSTAGSPGTGLGALERLSHLFEIHSSTTTGTAILSRVLNRPPSHHLVNNAVEKLEVGSVCLPMRGETACGDNWAYYQTSEQLLFLVADGLGHGLAAADAANEAIKVFEEHKKNHSAIDIFQLCHAALKKTRGAAMAMASLDFSKNLVQFVGVGNIAGVIVSPDSPGRSMVSHNGTVGSEVRKIQEFTYPWKKGSLLVLHSDGLTSHWKLDGYAGLKQKHPSLIAGVLYRDFNRERDDVTVIVAKEREK